MSKTPEKAVRVAVFIPPDVYARFCEVAAKERRSEGNMALVLIEQALNIVAPVPAGKSK